MSERSRLDIIQMVMRDSNYHLDLFTKSEIQDLEEKVLIQNVRGKQSPFIYCDVRGRHVQLKPEELVRQLYSNRLRTAYGYPLSRLEFEYTVDFGREKKRADIVIFDNDRSDTPYVIIEVKQPRLQDGKAQLKSYCNATGAPIAVWTNGQQISHYHRKDPNYFEDITDIPKATQTLDEIVEETFTLKDLILKDKLATERKTLKDIILELEDEVLANAGVDVFEEVFKLIFTKLYDEFLRSNEKVIIEDHLSRHLGDTLIRNFEEEKACLAKLDDSNFKPLLFRNTGQTDSELKKKIQQLFDDAKDKWQGIFPDDPDFKLSDSHLAICVSSLQDVKLFNSNLIVLDEAFEYLVSKSAKAEKGQYFTPRHVIDMCVQMLNPKRGEYMIDTAAGSCGFPVHTIFKLTGNLFTNKVIPDEDKEHVLKVFGVDFDETTVRVARTLNLIAGDGETNVLELNTLDYKRWADSTENNRNWINTYGNGFSRLERLRANRNDNKSFNFDILMANPPFAGDIKEPRILHQYDLSFKNGKAQKQVGREILFIERNLDFLKPGGRMAIVLPLGKFSAPKYQYIREYIAKRARILAIVSLHENTFRPHTDTKTSVLFVQRWNDDESAGDLCPKPKGSDYNIFFGVSQKSGKNTSGDYIHVKETGGVNKLDKNGHVIVDHDLHNHDEYLNNGIADSFRAWGKKENLSFADADAPDWQPLSDLTFEKNYLAIQSEERMDAVFFHPKFEKIETSLKSHSNGYTRVGDEFKLSKESPKIDPEKRYRYVEIGSIDIHTGNIMAQELLGKDLPSGSKRVLKNGDVIVAKVRTYRGAITIVQEDGYIGSGAFCVLRENGRINKETLLSLLRTQLFLDWSLKGAIWTSYPALNEKYILNFPIPLLSEEEQAEMRKNVTDAFDLLKQSALQLSRSVGSIENRFELEDDVD